MDLQAMLAQAQMGGMGGRGAAPSGDMPLPDTGE